MYFNNVHFLTRSKSLKVLCYLRAYVPKKATFAKKQEKRTIGELN